ncbi:MAG: damage-inducible protein DinB, partial [Pedobacter sp.]|nr:damage-inducible protein DinB [Pedobacter sp.]
MKTLKFLFTLSALISLMGCAFAQETSSNTIADWERAKTYTKEYLDVMPEAGYALKPTPEMRSFAEQMLHLTDANYGFASATIGEKSPYTQGEMEKSTDKSKANVTKQVLASYDYVIQCIRKLTPAQMKESIKLFDQFQMSRSAAFAKDFEH